MCAALSRLGLFAPFSFTVMHEDVPGLKLEGMYRIDQAKFDALKPATLKALQQKGFLGHIYAHLQSLENFAALYARAVARNRPPAG
jgi:hypothetical protein